MRVDEHAKQDGNSNVAKHAVEQRHATVTLTDFKVLTNCLVPMYFIGK